MPDVSEKEKENTFSSSPSLFIPDQMFVSEDLFNMTFNFCEAQEIWTKSNYTPSTSGGYFNNRRMLLKSQLRQPQQKKTHQKHCSKVDMKLFFTQVF